MTRRRTVPTQRGKRLVAHVEPDPHGDDGGRYGPRDGEPVGVPAPCVRLIAGYWCACGSGFFGLTGHEHTSRARVEIAPDGAPEAYIDGRDGYIEPGVLWPTRSDRQDLQDAIERLPVGTVVERHGCGIAPAFDLPQPRLAEAAGDWGYPF